MFAGTPEAHAHKAFYDKKFAFISRLHALLNGKATEDTKRDFFATSTALWYLPILCQGFHRQVVPSHTAHPCYSLHWHLFQQTAGKSYRCHRLKNLFQLVHVHPGGRLRIHRLRQCPSLVPLPTLASRSTWRRLTQHVQAKPNASLPEIYHDVSQPVFADHALMPPIYQNVHQPQTLPVSSSDHQPEVHVVRIRRVYMSDSDYMESSSEGDSEFDDDSGSSEDDEEDISAPIAVAGPSKVDKGKGKAPWSCSRLATMSERYNHHHRPRPPDPSRSAFIYPET